MTPSTRQTNDQRRGRHQTQTKRTKSNGVSKAKTSSVRNRRKSKKAASGWRNPMLWIFVGIGFFALLFCLWLLGINGFRENEPEWIKIPRSANSEQVGDSLQKSLGPELGKRVFLLWKVMGGNAESSRGAYRVTKGDKAIAIAHRIARGHQTPLRVTITNTRTMGQLSEQLASKMDFSSEEFLAATDSVLTAHGLLPSQYPAVFMPDTYEFYWTSAPALVTERFYENFSSFWNGDRAAKAKALGLTPIEVETLASIVEEETAKRDERPMVARLYLNRLHKGMKLQADPTVKYAVGDFTLRRILSKHLQTSSPYNTYINAGLPPGPIRMPEAETIDGVLNAPMHHYIYMCAREDFSGYHNFAVDYSTHMANAAQYRAALDKRNIR